MDKLHEGREFVKVLIWNIYQDQYNLINQEGMDGKSSSEIIRRVIDHSIKNRYQDKYLFRKKKTERALKKVPFTITNNQYKWLVDNFPSRKKADGLRYMIDQYFELKGGK